MEENTQEKNLIEKKEKNIFGKIKKFFKNLFSKKIKDINQEEIVSKEESINTFKESIKMEEDEEAILLNLQKRYRRGEIAEGDLTEEQIEALCDLYDRQIETIKKAIAEKEQKIANNKQQKVEENNA